MSVDEEKLFHKLIKKYPADADGICELLDEGHDIYFIFSTLQPVTTT